METQPGAAAGRQDKVPEPAMGAGKPESPAVMWLMFFATGVIPVILFAVFDWFSASFALSYFLPPLPSALLYEYSVTFALGAFCWMLFMVRPVVGAKSMEADRAYAKRRVFEIFAIPGIILSAIFSYAVAKNGFGLVETAMVSTAFWLVGLFAIQAIRYADEFVLKNRPDCEACHSPLELALFLFAAAPGAIFALIGFALAMFL